MCVNEDKILRMKDLIKALTEADIAYYRDDDPVMSDREYDQLTDELLKLEAETGLVISGSPTQKVSGEVLEELTSVRHTKPMLSAKKTKSIEEMVRFAGGRSVLVSWKLDGLTIVLRYENGELKQSITRGREGTVGEDVTHTVRTYLNVPLTIPIRDSIEVRGEGVISWRHFNLINSDLEDTYSHPRNLAAGSTRKLDANESRKRLLEFFAFDLVSDHLERPSKLAQMQLMQNAGFSVVPFTYVDSTGGEELLRNDIQMLSALKLPWDAISRYLETLISAILGRSFTCSTKGENDDYWRTSVLCDTFTNVEIVRLVNAVNGDDNMLRHALPVDSTVSRSLEMGLCQALLKRALKLDWENEFVSPDALFIIGKFPAAPKLPDVNQDLIHIDSATIDSSTLMSKDEFLEKLFDEGGTFTDLASLCEANETAYGTPLYWMHPFTDGEYNGCYFVLVREGVLVLSYDEISTCDHEIFIRDSAHLCYAEEMRCFLTEWNIRSTALIETITTLLSFLEQKKRLCCER